MSRGKSGKRARGNVGGRLLGRLRRRGAVALVFVVVGAGLWSYGERGIYDRMSWQGVPERGGSWLALHRVMRNEGYLVGWSDVRVSPLWASYELMPVRYPDIASRPSFKQDWRTLWPVATSSYRHSGYDRRHLAPNYAIAAVHGSAAQQDTFLMSNMVPQKPNLNRQLWQRLEEVVMDHFVPRFGRLQVIAGPIYEKDIIVGGLNRVGWSEVPIGFFKILIVPGEVPRALAFAMPQDVAGNESLSDYLVSIDDVESLTGLNFMPQLDAASESALEAGIHTAGWGLEEVADRPGRFD
ncbi:DNA/RNA non-specific endonuclease [Halomonas halocynthiae]|uniref:DNA/RNA non-specific endonuclease n=1 Tax=Halomonas halocynthiae TaxID=176290 RepID=UPI000420ECAA|nr:DNA/RNA non-specific endonuclease [Halomonas halocynthiae]